MSRTIGVTDKTEKLYSEIKADLPYNRTLPTLLVEAEIDAVGLYSDNDSKVLYAIDTAYHDDGIVYGDDTVKSILNKFRRISLLVTNCFDFKEINIYFAGNKLSKNYLDEIQKELITLQEITGYNYEVIVNKDFLTKILDPVICKIDSIKDHNECSVRMLKLLKSYDLLKNNIDLEGKQQ